MRLARRTLEAFMVWKAAERIGSAAAGRHFAEFRDLAVEFAGRRDLTPDELLPALVHEYCHSVLND